MQSHIHSYAEACGHHPEIPLFMQPWWLDAACDSWATVTAHNGSRLSGIWPFQVEKRAGVTLSRNPLLTPYLGPFVLYPPDLKESKRDNFEHEAISSLLGQLPRIPVWHTALQPGLKQAGVLHHAGFATTIRQTFLMDLAGRSEEEVFSRLHEEYRRNIRKASRELVVEERPGRLDLLYSFHKETLAAKGISIPYSFDRVQRLFEAGRSRGQSALYMASRDGEPRAMLWHAWDAQRGYYLVGAKNPQVRDRLAITALIWHAIRRCLAAGRLVFDFEGSMDPGVEHFFRHFGARRELYPVISRNSSLIWRLKELLRG